MFHVEQFLDILILDLMASLLTGYKSFPGLRVSFYRLYDPSNTPYVSFRLTVRLFIP